MPKIQLTPELTECLKGLRKRHNVTAKDLSASIGKSPSYITQLEKNMIKQLDLAVFNKLLTTVVGTDERRIQDAYEEISEYFTVVYSAQELEYQLWFANHDQARRVQPVAPELIAYFNAELQDLNYTPEQLVDVINANLDLSEEELSNNQPFNEWYYDEEKQQNIKFHFELEKIKKLLDGQITNARYITILSIAYNIERIKANQLTRDNSDSLKELQNNAYNLLKQYKFYRLTEKEELINSSETEEELESILSPEDYKNHRLLKKLGDHLHILSDLDVSSVNKRLEAIDRNLDADFGLIFSIYSLDYTRIKDCPPEKKKAFFDKFKELLEEFDYTDEQQEVQLYE